MYWQQTNRCYQQVGHSAMFRVIVNKIVSSTNYDDTRLTNAWTAIDKLSVIWKSDLTDKVKRSFFQAAVVSMLLYGCTTWTLTKRLEKKLDGNYTRMLRVISNKSWRQHPTKHPLYGHLPHITKTIQVRRTRHAGHCWRSRDELISDVFLWTPTYGRAKAGWLARTYIQQLCEDTGCSPEDLPEAMNDREKWRERVRDIRAGGTTLWWWWWLNSLPSLPSPLWPGVVAPERVLSMGQIEQFDFLNWMQKCLMLSWIAWNRTVWPFNCAQTNDWCLIELFVIHSNTWLTLLTYVYK